MKPCFITLMVLVPLLYTDCDSLLFPCRSTARRTFTRRSSIRWPARRPAFTPEPTLTTAPRMVRCSSTLSHSTPVHGSPRLNRTNQLRPALFSLLLCLIIFISCLTRTGSLAALLKMFVMLSFTFYSLFYSLSRLSALGGVQRPLWERGRGGGVGGEARSERTAVSPITPFLSPPTATPVSVEHNAGLFGGFFPSLFIISNPHGMDTEP